MNFFAALVLSIFIVFNSSGQKDYLLVRTDINTDTKHCFNLFFIPFDWSSIDSAHIEVDSTLIHSLNDFDSRIYVDECHLYMEGSLQEIEEFSFEQEKITRVYRKSNSISLGSIMIYLVNASVDSYISIPINEFTTIPIFKIDEADILTVSYTAISDRVLRFISIQL